MSIHLLIACAVICAAEPAGPPAKAPAPAPEQRRIRKIGEHLYRVGAVVLDAQARTVRCKGRVNMDRGGPIELLACLPTGKTHESVLTLDVAPLDLQVALLLLDLKPGRNPAVRYHPEDPDRLKEPADSVLISVEWTEPPGQAGGEPTRRSVRAEKLLLNLQAKRPEADSPWAFLGSRRLDERFGADVDGSLITTFYDPLAILELAVETANDDIYYDVNAELCPPVGTPVELVIRAPARKQKSDAKKPRKAEADAPPPQDEPEAG